MALLAEIDRFQRVFKLTDTGLSLRMGCYKNLIGAVRNGLQPRPHVEARMRAYMASEVARFRREYDT